MSEHALLALDTARENRFQTDWDTLEIAVPWFIGKRVLDEHRLKELLPPDLQEQIGSAPLVNARAVYGFWPANSVGDDIIVYKDDARRVELARFHMLRQQTAAAEDAPNRSLADFVAPKDSMAPDYIGAFAVAVDSGLGDAGSDAVEAVADALHAQARSDFGYADAARGIRPAFGNSACPDVSERRALFQLLDVPAIGITLTEHFEMLPASSTCGLYFSHPKAAYFDVGPVGLDQLEDYAQRKSISIEDARRWLPTSS